MKKVSSVEEYIENNPKYADALHILRNIILKTELEESIKWNAPVYSVDGKNVIGLGAFKNHFGIWFFNGIFLKDNANILHNAQEGKTKALRQMRFEDLNQINEDLVLEYVKEAIDIQKSGKIIIPTKTKKSDVAVASELLELCHDNKEFKLKFDSLSPYKQKEYSEYISQAKRESTKKTRLEKIIPMILEGKGLNDKYKNC